MLKNYKNDKCLNITNSQPKLTTDKGIKYYRASSKKIMKDNELYNVFNDGPKDYIFFSNDNNPWLFIEFESRNQ